MDTVSGVNTAGLGMQRAASVEARPELADLKARTQLVGLGYKEVGGVFLMEIGDEFLDVEGKFRSISLDSVGYQVPQGVLVRRFERRFR